MPSKKEKRQYQIHQILLERDRIKISELAKELHVTPETLRSDLNAMDHPSLIREHGYVRMQKGMIEPPVTIRNLENQEEKKRLALHAMELIQDGNMVYIDSGSTIIQGFPALLKHQDLTIVTNSLSVANACAQYNIKALFLGGFIFHLGLRTYGNFATEMIDRLQIDIAFLGTDGFKDSIGFTTINENELGLKRHLLAHSAKTVIVADHSKFETRSPYSWCRYHEIDVLVTSKMSPEQKKIVETIPTILEYDQTPIG